MSLVRRALDRRTEHRDATLSDLMVQRDRLASSYAGVAVNALTALQNSAYWACVNLIVNTISGLPVSAFRVRAGTRGQLEQNPTVVETPSGVLSRSEWIGQVVHSAVTRGNGFGVVVARDAIGYATQVEVRAPDDVQIRRAGKTGPVEYRIDSVPVPRENVFHVRGLTMPGGVAGIPAIEAMRDTIGTGLAAERYGAQWFADGAHPSSVLSSEISGITEEQAKIVKTRFLQSIRGREPVVLGQGLKYQPVQETPQNSMMLEIERFIVEEVARFFGISPEMVGAAMSGSSVTYANREQRAIDFINFAIKPWVVRIEEPWSALLPRGQYVRFNFDDLLRTDFLTRMQGYAVAIRSGIYSANKVLDKEHEDGIGPDGDRYLWPPYAVKEESTQPETVPAA